MNQFDQALGIEVNIRERGEDGLDGKRIDLCIGRAKLTGSMCVHRDTFDRMN